MPQPINTSAHTYSHAPDDLPYEDWLRLMMDFFRKGGEVAKTWQRKITPSQKTDLSLVTEADLEISALVHRVFAPLKEQGHLILDEETVAHAGQPTQAFFKDHPFIWVIDPIDGTSSYAAQRTSYAISIGLLRHGKPLMGGVYMPATDELFIYNGNQELLMYKPFSTRVHTEPLAMLTSLQGHVFFDVLSKKPLRLYDLSNLPADITASNAAAIGLAHVAAGRACGSYFNAYLWDMAGAWPLLEAVGAKLHNLETGAVLTEISADLLEDNWKLKGEYIACNPAFFEKFQQGFEKRGAHEKNIF